MLNPKLHEISSKISEYLDDTKRINNLKQNKYWYPLNVANYNEAEILEALDSMCAYQTSMSQKTQEFELEFGKIFDRHAVMVNSGSSADLLIMFALHQNSGGPLKDMDEVLIPAVTWPTQLWSIVMAGFRAKMIDVDTQTLNISIESLKKSISDKTKVLFITHLMGNVSNMDEVQNICREKNIILIEDSCESLGSKWKGIKAGTFGIASSFSFFFSHHITTMEGGMILTPDKIFADRLRTLRSHGWSREVENGQSINLVDLDNRYTFIEWGFNVRPTELQAGFGSVQIKKLNQYNKFRIRNAEIIIKKFEKFKAYFSIMKVPENVFCSWFALPIIIKPNMGFTKSDLTSFLESNGVETRPIVAGNLARQPATLKLIHLIDTSENLNGADIVHNNGLYIGIRPYDSTDEIGKLFDVFAKFFKNIK